MRSNKHRFVRRRIVWALNLLIFINSCSVFYDPGGSKLNTEAKGPPPQVYTCSPSSTEYAPSITVPGTVISLNKHEITCPVEGKIIELAMHNGRQVSAGQKLVGISTERLELQHIIDTAQLKRKKIELQQARSTAQEMLRQAEGHLIKIDRLAQQEQHALKLYEHAQQEYLHAQSLQKSGGISKAALEKHRLAVEQQHISLAELQHKLKEARIGLRDKDLSVQITGSSPTREPKWNFDCETDWGPEFGPPNDQRKSAYLETISRRGNISVRLIKSKIEELESKLLYNETQQEACTVPAPAKGFLTDVRILPGAYLNVGDPLATLVVTDSLCVQAEVPSSYHKKLSCGQATVIEVPHTDTPLKGSVKRTSPTISTHNRSFEIISSISPPQSGVCPGTGVQLTVLTGPKRPIVSIPSEALVRSHDAEENTEDISIRPAGSKCREGFVFVVRQNRAFHQPVQIVQENSEAVFVSKGVTTDDHIVLSPPSLLKEGMEVQVLTRDLHKDPHKEVRRDY